MSSAELRGGPAWPLPSGPRKKDELLLEQEAALGRSRLAGGAQGPPPHHREDVALVTP